jgi:hypothetical protein
MSVNTPDNMSRITKTEGSSVTRTNRIATSTWFQSYAQALQNMIPTTITTNIASNAWKRRPPAALNYNAEEYPVIEGSKRQRANDTDPTDNSSNPETAGDTIMMIDLDELQSAYESKCMDIQNQLQTQIEEQNTKMEQMRQQLTDAFEKQLKQLELKMETNMTQMLNDFGKRFQIVMTKLEESVDEREEIKNMMKQILMAVRPTSSGDITPTIGNTPRRPTKMSRAMPSSDPRLEPMNIDHPNQADGSLTNNPPASHATHQRSDSFASAGASK